MTRNPPPGIESLRARVTAAVPTALVMLPAGWLLELLVWAEAQAGEASTPPDVACVPAGANRPGGLPMRSDEEPTL